MIRYHFLTRLVVTLQTYAHKLSLSLSKPREWTSDDTMTDEKRWSSSKKEPLPKVTSQQMKSSSFVHESQ